MISNRFIYKKPKNTTKPVEDSKLSNLVQAWGNHEDHRAVINALFYL